MNAVHSKALKNRGPGHGFTLLELLVVIAIVSVLAAIILPALARAKSRAQGTFCLNNTRQLVLAWMTYGDEHNDRLAYNLGVGNASATGSGTPNNADPDMSLNWANNVLDWDLRPDNTNATKLAAGGLGPYLNKATAVYRCPSDNVLSAPQKEAGWTARVRSYSMNAMVGDAGSFSQSGRNVNNPDYIQFFKLSSIPRAGSIFVFLDEHPDTISDGYFLNKYDARPPEWLRLPASYHDGAASFAFADGHSEMHRWRNALTKPSALPGAAHPLPIQIPSDQRADYYWVITRMSVEPDEH
jgi:prepilin-type N-terminal cleavage/methylation domain-containing protein/prepilin-type processing-associated H-X9-DG protein